MRLPKYTLIALVLLTSILLLTPLTALAQSGGSSVQVGTINDAKLGIPTNINDIIGSLIQLIYAVAGIVFFFMLLLGGIRYLTAGGDEKAVSAARNTLQSAFIGLVIVAAAFVVTELLFNIFNIDGFIQLL